MDIPNLFSDLSIGRRTRMQRRRGLDVTHEEAKAKYFEELDQHFKDKTFYIVTQHDNYPGSVSFEYTYKLRDREEVGFWTDVIASIVEIAEDGEEKLIPIINVHLYSNNNEIRICKIDVHADYKGKGHTKRLLQGIFLDLSPYFEAISVYKFQAKSHNSKKLLKSLQFQESPLENKFKAELKNFSAIVNDTKMRRSYCNKIIVTSFKCTNPDAARAIICAPLLKEQFRKLRKRTKKCAYTRGYAAGKKIQKSQLKETLQKTKQAEVKVKGVEAVHERVKQLQTECYRLRKQLKRNYKTATRTLQHKIQEYEKLADDPKLKKYIVKGVIDTYMEGLKAERDDPMFLLNALTALRTNGISVKTKKNLKDVFKQTSNDKRYNNVYKTTNRKVKFTYLDKEFEADSLNTVLDADDEAMRRILKHLCLSGTMPTMVQIPGVKCKHMAVDLVSYLKARLLYLMEHETDYRELFKKEVMALILYSDGAKQCTFGTATDQLLISVALATDSMTSVFSKMCIISADTSETSSDAYKIYTFLKQQIAKLKVALANNEFYFKGTTYDELLLICSMDLKAVNLILGGAAWNSKKTTPFIQLGGTNAVETSPFFGWGRDTHSDNGGLLYNWTVGTMEEYKASKCDFFCPTGKDMAKFQDDMANMSDTERKEYCKRHEIGLIRKGLVVDVICTDALHFKSGCSHNEVEVYGNFLHSIDSRLNQIQENGLGPLFSAYIEKLKSFKSGKYSVHAEFLEKSYLLIYKMADSRTSASEIKKLKKDMLDAKSKSRHIGTHSNLWFQHPWQIKDLVLHLLDTCKVTMNSNESLTLHVLGLHTSIQRQLIFLLSKRILPPKFNATDEEKNRVKLELQQLYNNLEETSLKYQVVSKGLLPELARPYDVQATIMAVQAAKILLTYGLSLGHVGSLQDTEHLNKIWKAISSYPGTMVTRNDAVEKTLNEHNFAATQKVLRQFMDDPNDVDDEDIHHIIQSDNELKLQISYMHSKHGFKCVTLMLCNLVMQRLQIKLTTRKQGPRRDYNRSSTNPYKIVLHEKYVETGCFCGVAPTIGECVNCNTRHTIKLTKANLASISKRKKSQIKNTDLTVNVHVANIIKKVQSFIKKNVFHKQCNRGVVKKENGQCFVKIFSNGKESYKGCSFLSHEEINSMKGKLKVDSNQSLQDFILNVYDLEETFAKLQSAMVIQGTGLKGSKSHFNMDQELQDDVNELENPEEGHVSSSLSSSQKKKTKKRKKRRLR